MTSVQNHPEIEALRRQRAELRTDLADLLEEWHILQSETLPEIRRQYDVLFRTLELQLQTLTMQQAELARREELFRMKLERGETLSADIIRLVHELVDKEFARLRERMRQAADFDRRREQRKTGTLSEAQHAELPQMYREVVKKLHPDSGTASRKLYDKYWTAAQEAYASKNITRLHSIHELICAPEHEEYADSRHDAQNALQQDIASLQQRIATERERLRKLKERAPYTFKDKLDDSAWKAEQSRMLGNEISVLNERIARHNTFLTSLLGREWQEQWKQRALSDAEKEARRFDEEFMDSAYFGGMR